MQVSNTSRSHTARFLVKSGQLLAPMDGYWSLHPTVNFKWEFIDILTYKLWFVTIDIRVALFYWDAFFGLCFVFANSSCMIIPFSLLCFVTRKVPTYVKELVFPHKDCTSFILFATAHWFEREKIPCTHSLGNVQRIPVPMFEHKNTAKKNTKSCFLKKYWDSKDWSYEDLAKTN